MQSGENKDTYRVWGTDYVAYGPLSLSDISRWISGQRLTSANWIYSESEKEWRPADEWAELRDLLRAAALQKAPKIDKKAAASLLRGLDLFAGLTDAQIDSFANYAEIVEISQFTQIVKKGDPGDAMFIVLEGEVRAYFIADGRECTLSSIGPGEFVGEISLLDEGPRSADLAANVDTTLLRLSVSQFQALFKEAPALAAPFLLALSRTVVKRIRTTTQRYQDSIHYMGRKIAGWSELR